MDFMAERLFDGRRFRLLTLVDEFTRESLAIRVGQRLTGDDVVAVLEEVRKRRGTVPESIRVGNGPEFVGKSLDWWAYCNQVTLDFSRPGKPTDNAFIESFNGRLRQECLNQHWFLSLPDAADKVEAWRIDYNTVRPHSSLSGRTPKEFAASFFSLERRSDADPLALLLVQDWGEGHGSLLCSRRGGQSSIRRTLR